jgi:hypothetical protein
VLGLVVVVHHQEVEVEVEVVHQQQACVGMIGSVQSLLS